MAIHPDTKSAWKLRVTPATDVWTSPRVGHFGPFLASAWWPAGVVSNRAKIVDHRFISLRISLINDRPRRPYTRSSRCEVPEVLSFEHCQIQIQILYCINNYHRWNDYDSNVSVMHAPLTAEWRVRHGLDSFTASLHSTVRGLISIWLWISARIYM